MSLRDDLAVYNERVKLLSGFANAVGLGLIGFAVLRPLTDSTGQLNLTALTGLWGVMGLALHAAAHYILGMLKKKEAPNDHL